MELDSQTHSEVERLSTLGNEQFDAGRYREAIQLFCEALDLLPSPLNEWEASTWLFTSVGDALFHMKGYAKALDALSNAVHCPGGLDNPFIHLRLGQIQFELNNTAKAADELMRAYMAEGEAIFADEPPKYLDFLKLQVQL